MLLKKLILHILNLMIAWIKSKYFYTTALLMVSFYQFLHIAEDIVTKDKITIYDAWIVQLLNQLAIPEITNFFVFITCFGDVNVISAFLIITSAILLFRKRWAETILLITSTLGGTCLMFLTKSLFHRERPVLGAPILKTVGYSFPSGHTMVAVCFYGILIYLIFRFCKPQWLKLLFCSVFLILTFLISLSRVYLGVHYPSDILGGICLGLSWIALCLTFYIMNKRI